MQVVFVAGYQRSGSTLLDLLLGKIEGFLSLGEVYYVWERGFIQNQLCGCGSPFSSCPFWSQVSEVFFKKVGKIDPAHVFKLQQSVSRIRSFPFYVFKFLKTPGFKKELSDYSSILRDFYLSIQEISGNKTFIDSSKTPIHGFILKQIQDFDVRVIHLVRDSRAVAYSLTRSHLPTLSPFFSSIWWVCYNGMSQVLSRFVPYNVLVSYETLVLSPKKTVSEILEKLHIEANLSNFFFNETEVTLGINHTISGNPMRFKTGKINIRMDNEWKEKLPFFSRILVTCFTFPLLYYYRFKK